MWVAQSVLHPGRRRLHCRQALPPLQLPQRLPQAISHAKPTAMALWQPKVDIPVVDCLSGWAC